MKSFMKHFRPLPEFETRRLYLRRAFLTDTDDLYLCMRDPHVCEYEVWYPHKSDLETLGFVNSLIIRYDSGTCTDWVIERKRDGRAIGMINLHDFSVPNRSAEMGFWLAQDCWGNGYAKESAQTILRFAFNILQLNKMSCLCASSNLKSKKLMEKLRMTHEGQLRSHINIHGTFTDIDVYAILSKEFDMPQIS